MALVSVSIPVSARWACGLFRLITPAADGPIHGRQVQEVYPAGVALAEIGET